MGKQDLEVLEAKIAEGEKKEREQKINEIKQELKKKRADVMASICRAVNPENIFIEENLALIAIVGRGMVKAKGTAARVFAAISNAGINIRMIDQGSCELNIVIGVEEHDFEAALNAIYNEFVK